MGYATLKLDDNQREELLATIPARYPVVVCDHITLGFMKLSEAQEKFATPPKAVKILGIADDSNGIQALVVSVNGNITKPHDDNTYHITLSYDPDKKAPAALDAYAKPGKEKVKSYRPATSNGLLKQLFDEAGNQKQNTNPEWSYKAFDDPIVIKTYPAYIEGKDTVLLSPAPSDSEGLNLKI